MSPRILPSTPFYLAGGASALLFSVMVGQALYLNKTMPRFAPPDGPTEGVMGQGEPAFRVVLLGESPVAGVGAPCQTQALSGSVAAMLVEETGVAVAWRAVGRNGVTAATCAQRLVPALEGERPDLLVIALGINDVVLLHGARSWRSDLRLLLAAVRARVGPEVPILFSGVPPMGLFPAFPQPLRSLCHLQSRRFDRVLRAVVRETEKAWHVPLPLKGDRSYFCSDRYHPSPLGYAAWAEFIRPAARGIIARTWTHPERRARS